MARDVLIRLKKLSTTGKVPANAAVRFEPTVLRADADGYILDDYFDAVMVDGEATVTDLPETDLNWAYKVQVRGHGRGAGLKQVYATWYVHLPEGEGAVNFEDLPRIDPKTLTPVNDPDPKWVEAVTAVFSDSISTAVEPAMVTAVDDETSEFRARLNAASVQALEPGGAARPVLTEALQPLPAVQPTLARLARNAEDVTILVISDSTATDPWEWVRLTAGTLAERWPTHTVHYRLWDNTAKAWPSSPEVVSTGTGPRTLRIYNFSYPGWSTTSAREFYQTGVVEVAPHLIVVSHGHNEPFGSVNPVPGTELRSSLTNFMEQLAATHLTADLVMVAQNPDQLKVAEHSKRASIIQEICRANGYGFIDVNQRYLDAGVPAEWYLDSTHPNEAGMVEWADVVARAFTYAPELGEQSRMESSYMVPWKNLVTDGTFETYNTGIPAGWSKTPSATTVTATKDTTQFDSPKGYSIRLTSEPDNGAIYYNMPASLRTALAGQWVTFAARVYSPAGSTGNTGRVYFTSSVSNTSLSPTNFGGNVKDQWRWQTVTFQMPAGTSYAYLYIYTGSEVYVDRAVLVRGLRPHDAL